jgi:hypothetical protein
VIPCAQLGSLAIPAAAQSLGEAEQFSTVDVYEQLRVLSWLVILYRFVKLVYGKRMQPFPRTGGICLFLPPSATHVVGSESGKVSRQKSSGVSCGW